MTYPTYYEITATGTTEPVLRLVADRVDRETPRRTQTKEVARLGVVDQGDPQSVNVQRTPGTLVWTGTWIGSEAAAMAATARDDFFDRGVDEVELQATDDRKRPVDSFWNGTYRISSLPGVEPEVTPLRPPSELYWTYQIPLTEVEVAGDS